MINEKIRKSLCTEDLTGSLLFTNPSYDNSIIGISDTNRVIYSYDKMVEEYVSDNNCSVEEAIEFIEYNTIRALPYAGENAPIIMYELEGVCL